MYRRKLFGIRQPYNIEKYDALFVKAIKENIIFHYNRCHEYKEILDYEMFNIDDIKTIDDLYKIVPIPTTYLKTHALFSKPYDKCFIRSESSGTSGKPSKVGMDLSTCFQGLKMLIRVIRKQHLFSIIPHNYIILGYQPTKRNKMGAVKTAYGSTFLTPCLHREYALKDNGKEYVLNMEGIKKSLLKYQKRKFPVRLIGFPAYMLFLVKELKREGIFLKLNKKSKVLLGGGWKQFLSEKIDKKELYSLIYETLGIKEENCREMFGVVEHNIPYFDCKNHHFHVPAYSRIIIRDAKTLLPVPNGTPGLLNMITPMMTSMPLISVITDDIAILHDKNKCSCGINSPYFEILGRVGMSEIKTCVAEATELIGGEKK